MRRRRERNELRIGVRRAEVSVERAGLVVELAAPDLRLAVENRGAVRAIGVEARQPAAGLGGLVIQGELLVGLQQQLQGRQAAGILIDDQLQVVAGAVPLAGLGVDRAQPVAQIAEIGGGAGRQEAQQLLEPQRRGGGVAARQRQLGEHPARLDVARVQDRQLAVEAPPPRRCRRAAAPAPRAAAQSARAEPPRRRPGTLRARCRARARGASPACGSSISASSTSAAGCWGAAASACSRSSAAAGSRPARATRAPSPPASWRAARAPTRRRPTASTVAAAARRRWRRPERSFRCAACVDEQRCGRHGARKRPRSSRRRGRAGLGRRRGAVG